MADEKKFDLDEIIKRIMMHKIEHYIRGKLNSDILDAHTKIKGKGKKNLKEEAPSNAIGDSSSVSGSGPIDTFSPLIRFKKKKKKEVIK